MRNSLAAASILVSAGLLAQTVGPRPAFDAFEVATIHPTALDWRGGRFVRMETAHQLVARNHTLKTLLAVAFSLSPQAIFGGPTWLDSDKYDILARLPMRSARISTNRWRCCASYWSSGSD